MPSSYIIVFFTCFYAQNVLFNHDMTYGLVSSNGFQIDIAAEYTYTPSVKSNHPWSHSYIIIAGTADAAFIPDDFPPG